MPARRRLAAVVLAMAAFVLLVRPVGAAFTGSTSSSGNSFVSVADFETGSLLTWGSTNRAQTVPARVDSSTGWTASAIGSVSECEIRSPGTLWCWGSNTSGQLGLGDTTTRTVPTQVGTETTWTSVSEGNSHACATRSDGTLWCWGSATYGGLGNGGTATQTSPTQVTSPSTTGWGPVSVGYGATCSTRTDTTLWCWGDNQNAQIGDGTSTNRLSPTQVTTPASTGWSSVANGDRHTCAIRTGNLLYCWGNNSYGQLGQGNGTNSSTPIQVPGTTWSALAAGQFHSCATKTDGSLWCWGQNTTGQVGNGTTTNATSPARVGTGTSWSRVAAARQHTCAGQSDSTLWCWGLNGNGQLGDGTLTARTTPVQVVVPFPTGWSLTELGAEASRTCATRADSSLWCWGAGYGTVVHPALLDGTSTWRKPSNGLNFACALRSTGALFCWGSKAAARLVTTPRRLVSCPPRSAPAPPGRP